MCDWPNEGQRYNVIHAIRSMFCDNEMVLEHNDVYLFIDIQSVSFYMSQKTQPTSIHYFKNP